MLQTLRILICVALLVGASANLAAAQSAETLYSRALTRERTLRTPGKSQPKLADIRALVAAYEAIVARYPKSGYSDNALWQAAGLAIEAFERFGQEVDRRTGVRLLRALAREYPSSSLVPRVSERIRQFESTTGAGATTQVATRSAAPPRTPVPAPAPPPAATPPPPAVLTTAAIPSASAIPAAREPVVIRGIQRTPLAGVLRITVELDAEVRFREERLANPSRVFFDLEGTQAAPHLQDATLTFDTDVVREIRLGRHPSDTTRLVMDLEGVDRYSVFTLYNPFRIVIDCQRSPSATLVAGSSPVPTPPAAPPVELREPLLPIASAPSAPATLPAPSVPAANKGGGFSLARQLGLGVSRVVIDPGHGGHDPGAQASGLSEAELVLDVALRLEQLLLKEAGIEVVLTRRENVFVALEERTAIANREEADLFLSIHANASRNRNLRGIEAFVLNFATNPEAEAVAARENSASEQSMRNLSDIVRAITLNTKIDESRELASLVQQSMFRTLRPANSQLRNLGVKQAPFVVLIGAGMPSVLTEISFLTNTQEGRLLKLPAYRQRIAQALREAVVGYRKTLKSLPVAEKR